MPSQRYLFLHRSSPQQPPPSPAQMQEMYAAWNAWKEKFKANILDMGDKLKPTGKVVTASGVTDGPFVEAKEIVGGYMIVTGLRANRSRARASPPPSRLRATSAHLLRSVVNHAGPSPPTCPPGCTRRLGVAARGQDPACTSKQDTNKTRNALAIRTRSPSCCRSWWS